MEGKINNVIRIPTSVENKFFRYWFEFLAPFHKLTNKEMDVATSFVKTRFELSKVITDKELPIYSMKDIKITGDDIIKILGIEPGEKIKQILADIEINILDGTLINEYDILKTYINNNWR